MAWRLADSFVEGFLNTINPKSTFGVIALHGMDTAVSIQLTGDAGDSLRGRLFEFRRSPTAPPPAAMPPGLVAMQIGPVGDMYLRMVKVPKGDYLTAYEKKLPLEFDWVPLLYLEWSSQNGRVVLEVADPLIVIEKGDPFPDVELAPVPPADDSAAGLSVTAISIDDDGEASVEDYFAGLDDEQGDEEDDDLEAHLERLNEEKEAAMRGADPAFEREMELGERLVREDEGEFLASFLMPQHLPHPDDVTEEQAHVHVMSLLGELALRSVAVHLCPHCSWREAYRYVVDELIHRKRVPAEIKGSGWTMNYDYGETCPECIAEIEEKYRDFEPNLDPPDDEDDENDDGPQVIDRKDLPF